MVDLFQDLWPEVDRIALCVHRPAASDQGLRARLRHLQITAPSLVVPAARHLAAGSVTVEQLELLARYDSRELVRLSVERHVELGYLQPTGNDEFAPSESFRAAARAVLDVQAMAANELWRQEADLARLASLAATVVHHVASTASAPTPAFRAQLEDHHVTPPGSAGQLLAHVTELRYLRSDLHAHALAQQGLAGPTARAVDRLWKGHPVSDDDLERLHRNNLVENGGEDVQLTTAAQQAREQAELETDRLAAVALARVPQQQLVDLQIGLARLPGEDPRPLEDR